MKKLLVLMLVLGLTSAATALDLYFSVDGTNPASSMYVEPDNTYEVFVMSDTGGPYDYWTYVEADLPVAADFGDPETNWNIYPAAGDMAEIIDYSTIDYLDVELIANDSGGNVTSGKHFGIVLTISPTAYTDGSDDFSMWITIPNDEIYPIGDTFTFNIVPEPMTIALFGLGGLFLRRRKQL